MDDGLDIRPEIEGFALGPEIGRGASGRVFAARQLALDREVAVKIITTVGEQGRKRAQRLVREAKLAAALDHPNIVRAVDAGEGEGFCWLAMERVQGRDLETLVEEHGPLEVAAALRLGIGLLDALEHAHARGVVHRDVKPANVLVDPDGEAHLLDLGLARRERDPRLTDDGSALGTPLYMAPEQARAKRPIDPRTDVFGAGATLYKALTGVAPFEAPSLGAVVARLLYEPALAPSALRPGIPPALDVAILSALEKEPADRLPTAAAFRDALAAVRDGVPPSRPVQARRNRRPRSPRRKPLVVAAAGVLLLAASWAGYALLGSGPRDDHDRAALPAPAAPDSGSSDTLRFELRSLDARQGTQGIVTRARRARNLVDELAESANAAERAVVARLESAALSALERLLAENDAALEKAVASADSAAARATHGPGIEAELGVDDAASKLPGTIDARVVARISAARAMRDERIAAASRGAWARIDDELRRFETDPALLGAVDGAVPSERLDRALDGAAPRSLLDPERRSELERRRERILETAGRRPVAAFEAAMSDVEIQVRERRFASARRRLAEALAATLGRVPLAEEEVRRRQGAIDAAILALADDARRAMAELGRPGAEALPASTRAQRTELLREAEAGLSGLPEPVPELAPILLELSALRSAATAALSLPADAEEAARQLTANGHVFTPFVLGEGRRSPRRLDGVPKTGMLSTVRVSDAQTQEMPISALTAETLGGLVAAAGREVVPGAVVLAAHWDGDDAAALDLAAALADGPATARLRELARLGFEQRVAGYPTEDERRIAASVLRAHRALDLGRPELALPALDAALARAPSTPVPRDSLFNRARSLRERARAEAASPGPTGFRALEPFLRTRDAETGLSVFVLPLEAGQGGELFSLPSFAVADAAGLVVTPPAELAALPPDKHPTVLLPLPKLPTGDLSVSFELDFPDTATPNFVAVAVHDACFAAVGTLDDDRPFVGLPLHGLEAGLRLRRTFDRAGGWRGGFAEGPAVLAREKRNFAWPGRAPIRFSCVIRGSPRTADVTVGGQVFALPRPTPPKLDGDGIRIAGFPRFRVRDLRIEVRSPVPAPR